MLGSQGKKTGCHDSSKLKQNNAKLIIKICSNLFTPVKPIHAQRSPIGTVLML